MSIREFNLHVCLIFINDTFEEMFKNAKMCTCINVYEMLRPTNCTPRQLYLLPNCTRNECMDGKVTNINIFFLVRCVETTVVKIFNCLKTQ